MIRFVLFSLLWLPFLASAQTPSIGQWRDHLPYASGSAVAYTGSRVFCSGGNALFCFDQDDNSVSRLSKVNLLSDIGISSLAFDAGTNTLVVGYSNGNVDLIDPSALSTTNLSDIKRSSIIGDKTIYHIYPSSGYAYLSTGFGIVVLDLNRKEVKETYYLAPSGTSVKVNALTIRSDSLFAATEKGVYKAYLQNPFLTDYTSWTKDNTLPVGVRDSVISEIATFNNEVVAVWQSSQFDHDSVYRNAGAGWVNVPAIAGKGVRSMDVSSAQLIFSFNFSIESYDASFTQVMNIFDYVQGGPQPLQTVFGGNHYWIADRNEGLVKALNTWENSPICPDGPRSASSQDLAISDGNVWVAPGVVYGAAWLNSYNNDFISGRTNGIWQTRKTFSDPDNYLGQDSLFDFMAVAIDPNDPGHVFGGSMSFFGLVEMRNGEVLNCYDEKNSILPQWSARPGYCGITALTFDEDGNLWMGVANVNKPFACRKADGSFVSYDLGAVADNRVFRKIVCSKNFTYKWVAIPTTTQTGGLLLWDDKGTINNGSDDQYFMYSSGSGSGNLPSTDVYCVAEDLDDEIWIGTGAGIAVVYSQDAYFNGGNFDAQQILIEQDGNIQILLETEVITAIAVDGANRKWIGTDGSGVYLMSADGTEQLQHFTKDNSPLLSNQVNDIEIDHSNGEVYFATSQGIVSYRGTATMEKVPFDSVYAFPNPVRPDYTGIIAIKGLDRDTDVKITDIAGNVVFVTKSEGGQAIWDGKNLKGERVASGVYTVLTRGPEGSGKAVAKILFIN